MLKSDTHVGQIKVAAGSRWKEAETLAFLARVDAWTTDKTTAPPHGDMDGLKMFVKAVTAFGDDDSLIDKTEGKALFKLLPSACKHPPKGVQVLAKANPGLKGIVWILVALLAFSLLLGYLGFLGGKKVQSGTDAALIERAKIATEGYNLIVQANAEWRTGYEETDPAKKKMHRSRAEEFESKAMSSVGQK